MKKCFFLDDENIEFYQHAERIFHQPVKHGRPLLRPETKFEGNCVSLANAPMPSEDGRHLRLWYEGHEKKAGRTLPLYAESEDGLKWRRIALKLAKYGGSVKNNIVFTDLQADNKEFARLRNRAVKTCKMPLFSHLVIAPNPSWDGKSGTRYCGLMMKGGAKPHGLLPLSSPDGLKWRSLAHPDEPVIPSSDEYRLVCDTERKLLIATMKLYGFCMDIPLSVPEYGREVGLSTSTDGVTWTAPEFIYHADEADRKAGAEIILRHNADPDYRSPLFINPEDSWRYIQHAGFPLPRHLHRPSFHVSSFRLLGGFKIQRKPGRANMARAGVV